MGRVSHLGFKEQFPPHTDVLRGRCVRERDTRGRDEDKRVPSPWNLL